MKKRLTTIGLAAAAITLLSGLPAQAAPSAPDSQYRLPYITWVGGVLVDNWESEHEDGSHTGGGSVATENRLNPMFVVETKNATLQKGRMTIRYSGSKKAICDAAEPAEGRPDVFSCTPTTPLSAGHDKIEAVITNDGVETSGYSIDLFTEPLKPEFTIDYEDATRTAHLEGEGTPLADIDIHYEGETVKSARVTDAGTWTVDVPGIDRGSLMTAIASIRGADSRWDTMLNDPNPPKVDVTQVRYVGNQVFVTVTVPWQSSVQVIDSTSRVVTGAFSGHGETTLTFATGANEAHYSLHVSRMSGGENNQTVLPLVLHEGIGKATPDAVDIDKVSRTTTRALVEAQGEKGATARVLDAAGNVVAVKMIGATGKVSLGFPLSTSLAKDDQVFTIDQSTVTARSAATPFTVAE